MSQINFHQTIDWYNTNAEQYAAATATSASHEQLKEFVELLPNNGRVLDAGCGAGRDTQLLHAGGASVIGLDISSGLVEIAQKNHPELQFVVGDFLQLPFGDEEFVGVWAHASLLHLETVSDVQQSLKEFYRVLQSGGIVHILVKALTGATKTAVVSDSISQHDRFFQYFTITELQQLLLDAGFTTLKCHQYREVDNSPQGRPEVEWILALATKNI